jgi:hypothetical protein
MRDNYGKSLWDKRLNSIYLEVKAREYNLNFFKFKKK